MSGGHEEAIRKELRDHFWKSHLTRNDWDIGYQEGLAFALQMIREHDLITDIRQGQRDDLVICENCGGKGVLDKKEPPRLVKPYSGPFGLCGQQCRGPRDGDHSDFY